jgi:hypothetical protein
METSSRLASYPARGRKNRRAPPQHLTTDIPSVADQLEGADYPGLWCEPLLGLTKDACGRSRGGLTSRFIIFEPPGGFAYPLRH